MHLIGAAVGTPHKTVARILDRVTKMTFDSTAGSAEAQRRRLKPA